MKGCITAYPTHSNAYYIAELINRIEMYGYMVFCDTVHGEDDWYWIGNHYKSCPRMFYRFMENGVVRSSSIEGFPVDLVVSFNENEDVKEVDWLTIQDWLCSVNPWNDVSIEPTVYKNTFIESVIDLPEVLKPENENMEFGVKIVEKTVHEFKCQYNRKDDVMVYEVWKPFVDLPFCTVVRNWSEVGHLPMFTNWFIDPTWRLGLSERRFLLRAWKELKMEGELTLERLEEMYLHRVIACGAGEPEPEVWRCFLADVDYSKPEKDWRIESKVNLTAEEQAEYAKRLPSHN